MAYSVKEIFYTLQGEGARTGRPAVFCRFSGCNLWSGREADRLRSVCRFCDTDFVGTSGDRGGKYGSADELVHVISSLWPSGHGGTEYVVFTGGEPLLQLDKALIDTVHRAGFEIAVETNGTVAAPDGIDWICVSPKAGTTLLLTRGHELKVVVPQAGQQLTNYENLDFSHFYVQPMDGKEREKNLRAAVGFCLAHPKWKLSLQTHKYLQIP